MNDVISRFTSRKFLLAVFGVVTVFFSNSLNITPDQQQAIITLILAFTAAEGIADIATRFTNIPVIDDTPAKKK